MRCFDTGALPTAPTKVLTLTLACLFLATIGRAEVTVTKQSWGSMPDGRPVDLYTLKNDAGVEARVTNYGATLVTVRCPDRHGQLADVTLHLDSLGDYLKGHPLFGSTVGRYANRIAGARFQLDGTTYEITRNAGQNHIHGGRQGYQKKLWKGEPFQQVDRAGVRLSLVSPDGEEGYPGRLEVEAVYELNEKNELKMEYWACTDKPTHVNLTNHAYWNLRGAGAGDVLDQVLTLFAQKYLPSDEQKIPRGQPRSVKGTPMDFTGPHTIGERIDQVPGGYDHCYVLDKRKAGEFTLAVRLEDPVSGRLMEVWTTQPGIQLYTANGLSDRFGADGRSYGPHHGVCFEAQRFPDTPNRPDFPSSVLRPGDTYHEVTMHRFTVARRP